MVGRPPFFSGLILIDTWGEYWIEKNKVFSARETYGRILDTVQYLDIEETFYHTLYKMPCHDLFKTYFQENLKVIESLPDLQQYLPPGSAVLVGGGSFGGCFHHNPLGVISLIKANYQVFTHPGIIMLDWESENTPTYAKHVEMIENDKIIKWRSNNLGIYRAARFINDGE